MTSSKQRNLHKQEDILCQYQMTNYRNIPFFQYVIHSINKNVEFSRSYSFTPK